MCGVVGFVDRRGNCDSAAGRWLIGSLTDALLSRGPDDRAWCPGNTRRARGALAPISPRPASPAGSPWHARSSGPLGVMLCHPSEHAEGAIEEAAVQDRQLARVHLVELGRIP